MRLFRDRALLISLAWFAVLWAFGSAIGPSDDEAYYWVLAQKPALGYAFHPPAVAWMIALFGGGAHTAWLRLPAALSCAFMLYLLLRWFLARGASEKALPGLALFLLSFAPLFGLGWMMVPDVPLFLGLILAWCGSDALARGGRGGLPWAGLFLGTALAPLSKFSGIAVPFSAVLSFFLTAPPETRRALGARVFFVSLLGLMAGALPGVVWNREQDWAAFRFQFEGRHGSGEISVKRWLRFAVIQLGACGPPLVAFALSFPRRARDALSRQAIAWALPPLVVFGIQPFFSEFKPHWMLVAWLPFALEWGARHARGEAGAWPRAFRFQRAYGLAIVLVVWTAALFPLAPAGTSPKKDPTNDLVGWKDWALAVRERFGGDLGGRYVVGSRYQTASQAAFALGSRERVMLYPRSSGEEAEWGDAPFAAADGSGRWPRLLAPVLFVADNRYDAGPGFPDANCRKAMRTEALRGGKVAKVIETWECDPH